MTHEATIAREVGYRMEVKKHALSQLQDGSVKVTLTVHPQDVDQRLYSDPMGQRYMAVIVPLNEDETPKIQKSGPEKASLTAPEGDAAQLHSSPVPNTPIDERNIQALSKPVRTTYKPSQRAYLKAGNAVFQDYIQVETTEEADTFIKQRCGILSKSELDTNPQALAAFELLEKEYEAHIEQLKEEQRGR